VVAWGTSPALPGSGQALGLRPETADRAARSAHRSAFVAHQGDDPSCNESKQERVPITKLSLQHL
jgi:hypothetical protein